MTSEQERWLDGKIQQFKDEAGRRYPMPDNDWVSLIESVSKLFKKTGRRNEVKEALVKMLVEIESLDEQERSRKKLRE